MLPSHRGIVYGPVPSRRLGLSLGVNILPARLKVCNFNCPYCQYGWTDSRATALSSLEGWPSREAVGQALDVRLLEAAARGECIDRITLAGHGEPTLHPGFAEVVELLREIRDERVPGRPLAILSNSSTAHSLAVRRALMRLDERYMKLDAGDPQTLRRVNGTLVSLDALVLGLQQLQDFTIQSMFVTDPSRRIDNSDDVAVNHWIRTLTRINPRRVQVYTIDRPPAWSSLRAVSSLRLQAIGARARTAGLEPEVFLPEGHRARRR